MKGLSILGSTGSVGQNVLRVVDAFPGRFRVVGLSAGVNVEVLAAQIAAHRPAVVSVATTAARDALARLVDLSSIDVAVGEDGQVRVATHADAQLVVAAAVGAVGLVPTYAALLAGKDVGLANKETLVMAGELMLAASARHGGALLPIDSEHCALHQCLLGAGVENAQRLILTASGGPFRTRPRDTFHAITPDEALRHPTWTMGRKITIDSATLMNKGLEVIEARWLFDMDPARIEVLIHPQSIVHSMVEFVDGNVIAQLGVADMRAPIQYVLSWPERWPAAIPGLDFTRVRTLEFEAPDLQSFPCLRLAYDALRRGGTAPAVLNAVNEEAVAAFLEGRAAFLEIPGTIAAVLDEHDVQPVRDLSDVLAADAWARTRARETFTRRATA